MPLERRFPHGGVVRFGGPEPDGGACEIQLLQFPGPGGVRPGTLAERAGISKQAMNQLNVVPQQLFVYPGFTTGHKED